MQSEDNEMISLTVNQSQSTIPKVVTSFSLKTFPQKIFTLLLDAEAQGFDDIISWQPGGQSFKVHNTSLFEKRVMKAYFAQTKIKSFQRQLNIYGFRKVQIGHNKGGYHHPLFLRDSPELCTQMVRQKGSKDFQSPSGQKMLDSLRQSPENSDFSILSSHYFDLEPAKFTTSGPMTGAKTSIHDDIFEPIQLGSSVGNDLSFLQDIFPTQETIFGNKDESIPVQQCVVASFCDDTTLLSSPQLPLQFGSKWSNLDTVEILGASHLQCDDLDDLSAVFDETPEQHTDTQSEVSSSPSSNATTQSNLATALQEPSDNSFPYKLHLMLENAEKDNYSHIISWAKDGRAFRVHKTKEFVTKVLPMFFDQSKYESFRRQLNLYHFSRVARGKDRGIISHPKFLKGSRWLCEEIKNERFHKR